MKGMRQLMACADLKVDFTLNDVQQWQSITSRCCTTALLLSLYVSSRAWDALAYFEAVMQNSLQEFIPGLAAFLQHSRQSPDLMPN